MNKTAKTISIIVTVIVVGILIQWFRYESKIKPLQAGQSAIFPMTYFPFNGTYNKDVTGKITKS